MRATRGVAKTVGRVAYKSLDRVLQHVGRSLKGMPLGRAIIVGTAIAIAVLGLQGVAHADPLAGGSSAHENIGFGFTNWQITVNPQSTRDLSSYVDKNAPNWPTAVAVGAIFCSEKAGPYVGVACAGFLSTHWNAFVSALHTAAWQARCIRFSWSQSWTPVPILVGFGFSAVGGAGWVGHWLPYPSPNNATYYAVWDRLGPCHVDTDDWPGPYTVRCPAPWIPSIPDCNVF